MGAAELAYHSSVPRAFFMALAEKINFKHNKKIYRQKTIE